MSDWWEAAYRLLPGYTFKHGVDGVRIFRGDAWLEVDVEVAGNFRVEPFAECVMEEFRAMSRARLTPEEP